MYVIFEPRKTEPRRLFHFFVNRDFNHVYVMENYVDRQVVLEPMIGGLSLRVYARDVAMALDEIIAAGATAIVHYKQPLMFDTPRYYLRGMYTCVSAVKALLGLSGKYFWAVTPRQLYKRLLKDARAEFMYLRRDS